MVLVPWCAEWRFSRVCLLREGGITTLSSKIITPSDQYRASLRFYMEAMRGSAFRPASKSTDPAPPNPLSLLKEGEATTGLLSV